MTTYKTVLINEANTYWRRTYPRISFGKLSDEILLNIFERLSLDQVLSCQSVSHRWQKISTDPELWKRLYFLRYIQPRFTHISTSNRTRIASRDWWIKETTHTEDGTKKDWKKLFKIRHNWDKGRCAVSEIDISPSSDHLERRFLLRLRFGMNCVCPCHHIWFSLMEGCLWLLIRLLDYGLGILELDVRKSWDVGDFGSMNKGGNLETQLRSRWLAVEALLRI